MSRLESLASRLYDPLRAAWSGVGVRRRLGSLIVLSFLVGLIAIEMNRRGWLSTSLSSLVPKSHFHALDLAFSLLLLVEVVDLVMSLGSSVSRALGKQFEVFSLILLRRSFEELSALEEPVVWESLRPSLAPMIGDALGALAIFVTLGLFYRLQRHRPITADASEQASFIGAKKGIALVLLVAFAAVGAEDLRRAMFGGETFPFFDAFYTILIFSDILIVLLSLRTASDYRIVFRNSGFATATVLLRLALTAPSLPSAFLGLLAALFACGLTAAYNAFAPPEGIERSPEPERG